MSRMASVAVPAGGAHLLPRVSVAVVVAGFVAAVVALAEVVGAGAWWLTPPVLLPLVWLVAASLAVRARPEHPGALLFAGLGAGHLVGFALGVPLSLDRSGSSWDGWGGFGLDVVALLAYGLGFAALGAFLATYPSGRPGSAAERWFLRLSAPVVLLAVALEVTTHERVELVVEAARSTMPAPAGLPLVGLAVPAFGVVPLLAVVGAGLLVRRGRRANGEERRQLSWAAGAGGLLALMLLLSPVLGVLTPEPVNAALFLVVVSVIPFVLLAGLVRYRLMDVDLYVTRTLASGLVVVIVLTAYAVTAAVTADDRAATAAVVVVAALTGIPLMRLVSRGVDRWFSGGRVRGHELLRQLADSFDSAHGDEIASRTAAAVADGLDVAWVRLVAGDLVATAGAAAGTPSGRAPELTVPLEAGTDLVGRLECGPRHGGWSANEVGEVELLCHHAALALHNADLSRRLAAQVEELRASRLRIVRAELEVRRRLERDLHDGVQQQVVALIAHLGALRVMIAADSPAASVVAAAHAQAGLCLRDLRAVVQGVHPPVLMDQGVVEAVESRVGLLPVPVEVVSELERRYPPETEAAAYYVVSEALTNVVKHAAAGRAEVRFTATEAGALLVSVSDDGIGMAPDQVLRGLDNLRDRVEALDGRLSVESGPQGTTVSALLPTEAVNAGV